MRADLAEQLREINESRKRLGRLGYDWVPGAVTAALQGRQARWRALHDQSWELIGQIDKLLDKLGSSLVSIPDDFDAKIVRADAAVVIEHLKSGGKWTAFGLFTPKALKDRIYLREQVAVDGQPATTMDRLQKVCDHLDLTSAFVALELAWSDHDGLPSDSQLRIRVAAIKEHVGSLGSVLDYADACLRLSRHLSSVAPIIRETDWLNGQADEWLELIDASALEGRHRQATQQIAACVADLMTVRQLHDAHPVVESLIHAIEQRNVTAYSEAHQQVRSIEQTRLEQELRQRIENVLAPAVPGTFIGAVIGSLDDKAWDERFADWGARLALGGYRQLAQQTRRHHLRAAASPTPVMTSIPTISKLLAESGALRAWTHFFNRLSHAESAALKSWREAVRAMGRATGRSPRMERLRREARRGTWTNAETRSRCGLCHGISWQRWLILPPAAMI